MKKNHNKGVFVLVIPSCKKKIKCITRKKNVEIWCTLKFKKNASVEPTCPLPLKDIAENYNTIL